MAAIKQALISVSDKAGVLEFARGLQQLGVNILSTGGTAKLLADNGVPVTEVADYTGFPEMLDGRVKTLQPKVHAGILARRDLPEHVATLKQHNIPTIDLVVVNLYPFAATVAKPGCTLEDAIENIDIGGPTMVRAAAKNHGNEAGGVGIVTDPEDYAPVLAELKANGGALSYKTRFDLAKKAFTHTARYDGQIANWLTSLDEENKPTTFPNRLQLAFDKVDTMRYGENPHQSAAFYREPNPLPGSIAAYTQLQGKELSYKTRFDLAKKAFTHTARYDGQIANWLTSLDAENKPTTFPDRLQLAFDKVDTMRYGENPHQSAAFYREPNPLPGSIAAYTQLQGKELSYNTIGDSDAAWECVKAFADAPAACVIVKHANPCGVAIGANAE
ncbi:MAG TPA: hypothetical protein VF798_18005, partial [Burkholderiaceae bacterium]